MKKTPQAIMALASLALCGNFIAAVGAADAPATDPHMAADLARVRDAASNSDWAYRRLEELTDRIGPRLSGSAGQAAAITQVAAALRSLGARVTLQPAKVPHWVRGEERAELTEYAGRAAGLTQRLHLTALGSSAATPAGGLETRVIVVHDFAQLQAHANDVRGRIVLFDEHFDQLWAETGHAGAAYGAAGNYRFHGPAAAAKLGAAAALVRSVGGAEYRLPHTGITQWEAQQAPIPAAALAAEDADLVARLAREGPVTMKLLLTSQTLPDADSFNVIADWPGRERPDEVVIVSGHLDSWDLGTGATDDGVGVMGAAGVIEALEKLKLHARRTVRFIGWASEETGSQGAKAYFDSVQAALGTQCAAIESDDGAGRSLGILAAVTSDSRDLLKPVLEALAPIGASIFDAQEGEVGADIAALQESGVPGFAPLVDGRHYFDYHHSAADTLDKVDPGNLKSQVATMATLAYFLAERSGCLPRVPASKSENT
jgi:carboxypeptidase Q